MLLEYKKALTIMLENAKNYGVETVSFMDSLGFVLAEDIYSDVNMPPFDKSAMDGYACRKEDLKNTLQVLEVIGAGYEPVEVITENTCSKIMTGAKIPKGADTVIVVEAVEELEGNMIKYRLDNTKSNICYLAEDVKVGDKLIDKGTKIRSKHIPVLASVGKTDVDIYNIPKIAIISTGDELVEPDEKPNNTQIRNSNAYQLLAQIKELGFYAEYIGIAKDNMGSTAEILDDALDFADIIIVSGAVSVGDFDFVPTALLEKGFEFLFHGVATKPGKRTLFGVRSDNKVVIGVPGNPVSSFIQFQMLIKPFINKSMGNSIGFIEYKFELNEDFSRKNSKRLSFEPIAIINNKVEKIKYNGSANITALTKADGVMLFPKGVNEIKKGEFVDVRPI